MICNTSTHQGDNVSSKHEGMLLIHAAFTTSPLAFKGSRSMTKVELALDVFNISYVNRSQFL